MPARATWDWTEAFGAITVDTAHSHGVDWGVAVGHVGAAVEELVPAVQLEDWHRGAGVVADRAPSTMLATGSGWGALERRRRQVAGTTWFDETGTPFPDSSLGPEQEPWLELLHDGRWPSQSPACPPPSYVVGADWEERLGAAPPSWSTDYLGAVLAHGRGDRRRAVALYESSLRREANAWAWRGLAVAATADGRPGDAAAHAVAALRMAPEEWRLAAEAVARLLDDCRAAEALSVIDGLPADVRRRSRLRLLEGWAAHGAGDTVRAQAVLAAGLEVADLREGERSLDQLWNAVYPDRDVPAEFDFRMA